MSSIIVTRGDDGKLCGLGEKDQAAYTKLKKKMLELERGECMTISTWFDRNPKLHGLHFLLLSAFWDSQEQFDNMESFRHWVACGAGHCIYAPGPAGKMVAIPRSIAWTSMDDAEFSAYHKAAMAFLRSPRSTGFLWPHLSPEDQCEMVENIMGRFDENEKA